MAFKVQAALLAQQPTALEGTGDADMEEEIAVDFEADDAEEPSASMPTKVAPKVTFFQTQTPIAVRTQMRLAWHCRHRDTLFKLEPSRSKCRAKMKTLSKNIQGLLASLKRCQPPRGESRATLVGPHSRARLQCTVKKIPV